MCVSECYLMCGGFAGEIATDRKIEYQLAKENTEMKAELQACHFNLHSSARLSQRSCVLLFVSAATPIIHLYSYS